jgi:hypothetical protein
MLLAGVAVLVAALIGGGVTYLAATPSASGAVPAAAGPGAAKAGHGKNRAARAGGAGMLGKVEHGEFTTASAEVLAVQHGAIAAIDTANLTVKSVDGYIASYTIAPTTVVGPAGGRAAGKRNAAGLEAGPAAAAPGDVSQLHAGDNVQVMATKTNGAVTATRISPARS